MTGKPTDISAICAFEWYELVKYKDENVSYPFSPYRIGRCLCPCSDYGNEMTYYILTEKGKIIPCSTVRSLTKAEMNNKELQEDIRVFDLFIKKRFGDPRSSSSIEIDNSFDSPSFENKNKLSGNEVPSEYQ